MARTTSWLRGVGMVVAVTALSGDFAAIAREGPAPSQAAAAPPAASSSVVGPRVRAVKTGVYDAGKLVERATRACPSVRGLLDTIDQTDLVVFVEVRNDVSNGRAQLTMNGSRAGVRWLRVTIDAGRQWREQAAFLAHELRHAVEVGAAPDVQDADAFRRLYERIGWPVAQGRFETDAAIAAENQALREAYGAGNRRK